MARLPLQYAELEIARTETGHNTEEIKTKLDLFHQRTTKFSIPTLNERNNNPSDYCKLYAERYLPGRAKNLAKGAKVIWITPPSTKYQQLGEYALIDEFFGGTSFVESWVGWQGIDATFILDLGKEKEFASIESDFLHQLGQWILLPKKVKYSISSDNKKYQFFGEKIQKEDRDIQVKFVTMTSKKSKPVLARYIKVEIEGVKTCPSWHYGVGYPAWFFLDEITVR
ncbi:MAG: discoidin domain-containing protein [Chitinophagaceae bacterium]